MQTNNIQLSPLCITSVPLQTYQHDFTFVINGEEFQTSRLISDLLSPKISNMHIIDPTIDQFSIKTIYQGHFSYILNLLNFQPNSIPSNELPFISEVIQILGNETISLSNYDELPKLTLDNIFSEIQNHEKYGKFYKKRFQEEIEFISSHFFEICEKHFEELKSLKFDTLERIISSEKLVLTDENQLLHFVNVLYSENREFTSLYETVYFERVTSEVISEFIKVIDLNDITNSTWMRLSCRLEKEVSISESVDDEKRYKNPIKIERKQRGISLPFTENNEFKGIINYLREKSGGNIVNEINFTASSNNNPNSSYWKDVHNIALFDDKNVGCYYTKDVQNSWICLDFKNHKVIPTDYTIKTADSPRPKCWIIEASNDNSTWDPIDVQNDCPYLNGSGYSHSFKISKPNSNEYRYIRIRQTQIYNKYNHLGLRSFEIYGTLI